jgi:hypothetical protein
LNHEEHEEHEGERENIVVIDLDSVWSKVKMDSRDRGNGGYVDAQGLLEIAVIFLLFFVSFVSFVVQSFLLMSNKLLRI